MTGLVHDSEESRGFGLPVADSGFVLHRADFFSFFNFTSVTNM